ncbi:hypothetical protein [Aridibaculum aurantiacum]|uniref:hypothetical protein n=1 Tax=Aridibaculum aurantiacum TaxID=2810307 RepID=UPI001A97A46D|nr:hypothetical protein [Aridibaculum aurantiacum]
MFRIKSIIKACTESPKFDYRMIACLAMSAVAFIGLFYLIFPKFYYRYDFESQLILIISISLILGVLPNLIFSWIDNKGNLYEPENHFVLIIFALLTSIIFGMMSYGLQGIIPSTYLIDTNLINEEQKAFQQRNYQNMAEAKRKLRAIETLYDKAFKNSHMPVQLKETGYSFLNSEDETVYSFAGIEILFKKKTVRIDRGNYQTFYEMELSEGPTKVEVSAVHQILKGYPLPTTNTAQTILSILQQRKAWEIDVPIKQIANDSIKIANKVFTPSLSKYIYDALMGVLGNNTGYFKPFSVHGRIVEILKTLFKFFYVGYFVSFLVKRVSFKD